MKRTILIVIGLCLLGNFIYAQNCPPGFRAVNFNPNAGGQVRIKACVQNQVTLGKQSVYWGAENLTGDELKVKFETIIFTTCGNMVKQNASTTLKPGETVWGTTFSGEITFETQVWKEQCNQPKNRIKDISYENLVITNLSQIEREKAAREEKDRVVRVEAEKKVKEEQEKKLKETNQKGAGAQSSQRENKGKSKTDQDRPVYVESEETRKMRLRAEAQQKKNDAENNAAAAGAGGILAGGLGLLGVTDSDYDDEDYPVVVRVQLGASYQSIPVINNYNGPGFTPKSENSTTDPFCFNTGVEAKFFHDRLIGFNLNPFFGYGILAFGSSTGNMVNYGGNANLKIGKGLQLILKGGYEVRNGKEDYDAAEIGIDGTTYSKYNYNIAKYGLGLRYKFVELAAFKEQLSFEDRGEKRSAYSFDLNMAYSWFGMLIRYAPDYPAGGEIQYSSNYDFSTKKSLFQIGMYWRISVTKSH